MVTHNWNAQKDTFTMIDVFTNTKSILPSSRRKWNLWETPTYRPTPFDLIKSDNGSTIAAIRHGLVLVSCRQLTFNLILLIDSHGDPEMVLPPREKKLLHPLRSSSPRVSPRRLRERSKDLWEEFIKTLARPEQAFFALFHRLVTGCRRGPRDCSRMNRWKRRPSIIPRRGMRNFFEIKKSRPLLARCLHTKCIYVYGIWQGGWFFR